LVRLSGDSDLVSLLRQERAKWARPAISKGVFLSAKRTRRRNR